MPAIKTSSAARKRRQRRVRKRVRGTSECPRLSIFRSNNHMYAQVIDDATNQVLAAASSMSKEFRDTGARGGNKEGAAAVGALVAEKALKAGVQRVVFDRNGFLYHGRVAAVADAAREKGLEF